MHADEHFCVSNKPFATGMCVCNEPFATAYMEHKKVMQLEN